MTIAERKFEFHFIEFESRRRSVQQTFGISGNTEFTIDDTNFSYGSTCSLAMFRK